MAISSGDILFKFSTKSGSAGNSLSSDGDSSLGKYIATNQITDATLHELFDRVTGDENAANDVEYRCIFVHNSHGSLTLQSAVAWLSAEVANGASIAIAASGTAASAVGSASAQAEEVADESTAPTGPSFSAPTSKGSGISLGDIPAGQCKGIWVRRTAANSAALDNDGATIRVEGDTAA